MYNDDVIGKFIIVDGEEFEVEEILGVGYKYRCRNILDDTYEDFSIETIKRKIESYKEDSDKLEVDQNTSVFTELLDYATGNYFLGYYNHKVIKVKEDKNGHKILKFKGDLTEDVLKDRYMLNPYVYCTNCKYGKGLEEDSSDWHSEKCFKCCPSEPNVQKDLSERNKYQERRKIE